MNAEARRQLPADAPAGFVPARWQPYLTSARAAKDENAYKHWELASCARCKGRCAREIWVEGSRRYADLASYSVEIEKMDPLVVPMRRTSDGVWPTGAGSPPGCTPPGWPAMAGGP